MAAHAPTYVRRVVITVSIAAFAVLLVLAVWVSSRMLALIFGGILLAVLLRGLGELLSRYTGIRESRCVWIVVAALVAASHALQNSWCADDVDRGIYLCGYFAGFSALE